VVSGLAMERYCEETIYAMITEQEEAIVARNVSECPEGSQTYPLLCSASKGVIASLCYPLSLNLKVNLRMYWKANRIKMSEWTLEELWNFVCGKLPRKYEGQRDNRVAFVERAKKLIRERMHQFLDELPVCELEYVQQHYELTKDERLHLDSKRAGYKGVLNVTPEMDGQLQISGLQVLDVVKLVHETAATSLTWMNLLSLEYVGVEGCKYRLEVDGKLCSVVETSYPRRLERALRMVGQILNDVGDANRDEFRHNMNEMLQQVFPKMSQYVRTTFSKELLAMKGLPQIVGPRVQHWLIAQYCLALIQQLKKQSRVQLECYCSDEQTVFADEFICQEERTMETQVYQEVSCCAATLEYPQDVVDVVVGLMQAVVVTTELTYTMDRATLPQLLDFYPMMSWGASKPMALRGIGTTQDVKVGQRTYESIITPSGGFFEPNMPMYVQIIGKDVRKTSWYITVSPGLPARNDPLSLSFRYLPMQRIRSYEMNNMDIIGCPRIWTLSQGDTFCFTPPDFMVHVLWVTVWNLEGQWLAFPFINDQSQLINSTGINAETDIVEGRNGELRMMGQPSISWTQIWKGMDLDDGSCVVQETYLSYSEEYKIERLRTAFADFQNKGYDDPD